MAARRFSGYALALIHRAALTGRPGPWFAAMLVRAADARRIGVLIATDQQDVGVMTAASAEA